jgi:hypothetical protein
MGRNFVGLFRQIIWLLYSRVVAIHHDNPPGSPKSTPDRPDCSQAGNQDNKQRVGTWRPKVA